jgi:hypothetical protein
MPYWQNVHETTFNALYYKLFKGYRYPVGTGTVPYGFTGHHKRMVCVIIWKKDPEFKLSGDFMPYRIQ